eukprot:3401793-Pleurochrysis_carterae.AAC.1
MSGQVSECVRSSTWRECVRGCVSGTDTDEEREGEGRRARALAFGTCPDESSMTALRLPSTSTMR